MYPSKIVLVFYKQAIHEHIIIMLQNCSVGFVYTRTLKELVADLETTLRLNGFPRYVDFPGTVYWTEKIHDSLKYYDCV